MRPTQQRIAASGRAVDAPQPSIWLPVQHDKRRVRPSCCHCPAPLLLLPSPRRTLFLHHGCCSARLRRRRHRRAAPGQRRRRSAQQRKGHPAHQVRGRRRMVRRVRACAAAALLGSRGAAAARAARRGARGARERNLSLGCLLSGRFCARGSAYRRRACAAPATPRAPQPSAAASATFCARLRRRRRLHRNARSLRASPTPQRSAPRLPAASAARQHRSLGPPPPRCVRYAHLTPCCPPAAAEPLITEARRQSASPAPRRRLHCSSDAPLPRSKWSIDTGSCMRGKIASPYYVTVRTAYRAVCAPADPLRLRRR